MTPAEFRDAVLVEWKASPEDSMGPSLDRVLARMLDDARKARAAEISASLTRWASGSGPRDQHYAQALRDAALAIGAGPEKGGI